MYPVTVFATLLATVSAFPSALEPRDDPRFTQWKAPGAGDGKYIAVSCGASLTKGTVRSPCPGLNTLANHGFINHSGKNLTIPILIAGLKAGMNVGADFSTAIGGAGILSSPNPAGGSFDLNMLDQHNFPIEHDASLSRQDAYFGNDYSFYQNNWNMILNAYKGKTLTDIPTASKAKYSRVQDSQKRNPTFTYGIREYVLSYGETALYLQTMSDPTSNGVARLDFIRELFEKEKLPYDIGWRPAKNEITLMTLGQQVLQLSAASPEPVVEGLTVTANSYKDVLELIGEGVHVIGNLTSK